MKTITIEPLVDNNLSPKESFCMDGKWVYWGDMSASQREHVLNRKVSIAGTCKKLDEESFWLEIAELNNIEIKD